MEKNGEKNHDEKKNSNNNRKKDEGLNGKRLQLLLRPVRSFK